MPLVVGRGTGFTSIASTVVCDSLGSLSSGIETLDFSLVAADEAAGFVEESLDSTLLRWRFLSVFTLGFSIGLSCTSLVLTSSSCTLRDSVSDAISLGSSATIVWNKKIIVVG